MSARWSIEQVLVELKAAQSTLTRANVMHRPRESPERFDATVQRMRLGLAALVREARGLRRVKRVSVTRTLTMATNR